MNLCLYRKILIFIFFVLIFIPIAVIAENIEDNSIKIDGHWVYIYQLDDSESFEVNEFFYINNTGEKTFNDSFYIWIQNNSKILTECCNFIPNMACRYNATGEKECFFLNRSESSNIYVSNPITSEDKLSYYRQKQMISITAFSITNPSFKNDTLYINASIGGNSTPREQISFQDNVIQLTSENLDIGMEPVIDVNMPYHIMKIENLSIYNKVTNIEVIGFAINELPQGWTAEIWNDTKEISNISLNSQDSANLSLIITAPSYLASIYVRYITQIDTEGEKDFFIKQYLYKTDMVSYEVYLSSIDNLEVSNDLKMFHEELFWFEKYERYWFIARGNDIQPNSNTIMSVKFQKTVDSKLNPLTIIILIFIVVLIVAIISMKRMRVSKEKDLFQKRINYPDEKIEELQEQKKKILSAIKRVEQEFKENIISKEDYEQLRAAYKKRAVEILKEIDRLIK